MSEFTMNENEIDRLHHLITKTISLSLNDSDLLIKSNINNISLIPSYFMISKRLENIGNNIYDLAIYLIESEKQFTNNEKILNQNAINLIRYIKYLKHKGLKEFSKFDPNILSSLYDLIYEIDDRDIQNHLEDIVGFIIDIEEETANILFYDTLIKENFI